MAGATGLEPATSGVTGRRSNQLSYAPRGPRPGGPLLVFPARGVKYTRRRNATPSGSEWWAMTDSNRRPSRCKRDALPAELIAPGRRVVFRRCLRLNRPASIQRIAQSLTGLELGLLRCRDLDFLARARIPPLRCCA